MSDHETLAPRRRLTAPLVAAIAAGVLFVLFGTNLVALEAIHASRVWIGRAREAQTLIGGLRAALIDAETAERGYLLTGRADYLAPFDQARRSIPETLTALEQLTSDDPQQAGRVSEMERLTAVLIDLFRWTVALRQGGDIVDAVAAVRLNDAKVLMDRARGLIADMRAHEDRQLQSRAAKGRRNLDMAIWVDAIAVVALLGLGVILFAIHRDLARRQELEQALREEARFQEQFIGVLSHDLANPLSAVMMAARRLERAGLSDPLATSVGRIAFSAARMKRMVDQLREVTRARLAGGIPVQIKTDTDLCAVVRGTVEELRTANPDATLVVGGDASIRGEWDPGGLAQVTSNLLTNAIVHGAGPVDVRVRDDGGVATLEIHNGGPPIPRELMPRIFEAFHRPARPAAARSGGLGLGLFIAERIVVAHGGRIAVRSSETDGTTFTVSLPGVRLPPAPELRRLATVP